MRETRYYFRASESSTPSTAPLASYSTAPLASSSSSPSVVFPDLTFLNIENTLIDSLNNKLTASFNTEHSLSYYEDNIYKSLATLDHPQIAYTFIHALFCLLRLKDYDDGNYITMFHELFKQNKNRADRLLHLLVLMTTRVYFICRILLFVEESTLKNNRTKELLFSIWVNDSFAAAYFPLPINQKRKREETTTTPKLHQTGGIAIAKLLDAFDRSLEDIAADNTRLPEDTRQNWILISRKNTKTYFNADDGLLPTLGRIEKAYDSYNNPEQTFFNANKNSICLSCHHVLRGSMRYLFTTHKMYNVHNQRIMEASKTSFHEIEKVMSQLDTTPLPQANYTL